MRFRRGTLVLLGALLLVAAAHWQGVIRLPGLSVDPAEAIPPTMPLVLHFPEAERLWVESDQDGSGWRLPGGGLGVSLQIYREWFRRLGMEWSTGPLWLAIQHTGPGGITATFILDRQGRASDLPAMLQEMPGVAVRTSTYRGQTIYLVEPEEGPALALASYRNLLIMGRYPLQVEEAVGQLHTHRSGLFWQEDYRRLRQGWKDSDAYHIYLGASQLSEFPGGVTPGVAGALHREVRSLSLRAQVNDEGLALNGLLLPSSPDGFLEAVKTQSAARPDRLLALVPQTAARVSWWPVSDARTFYRHIAGSTVSRFGRYIVPWWDGEGALITLRTRGDGAEADQLFLAGCRDGHSAAVQLSDYAAEVGLLGQYNYQTFTVYQLLEEELLGPLSDLSAAPFKNPYYVLLDHYVIFAGSQSAIELWIDQYIVGSTLSREKEFLDFFAENRRDAHFFSAWQAAHPGHLRTLLDELGVDLSALASWGFLGGNVREKGGRFHFSGYWRSRKTKETDPNAVLWRAPLGAEARTGPFPLQLTADGPWYVAVQDVENYLYLFDSAGRLLWRRRLDGSLLSEVKAIGYFQAGGRALLASTSRNIYLLDEKGEDIGAFPLTLQTMASSGVGVADFQGNGDYAFFIPCRNGRIYGFDRQGVPLPGWNPRDSVGVITFPLQHFQQDNRDFMLALNQQGEQLIWQRNGSFRWPPQVLEGSVLSPPFFQLHPLSNRIVATADNGACLVTNLEGASFGLQLKVGNNRQVRFVLADVTGDARKDYAVLSENELAVYHYAPAGFVKAFDHRFVSPQDTLFAVSIPGSEKDFLGTLRRSAGQIFLLDGTGEVAPGFPLGGSTPFHVTDLFQNGEQVLVVANGEAVSAYRLSW